MLQQRDAAGAGGVLLVYDVHHRLREDLSVRPVRAVNVVRDQFAVSAEDAPVVHPLGGRHVHRVADAVGLDELKFRVAVGVAHLGRERVAVPGHSPHQNLLSLGKRKAVRNVDAAGLLGEVFLVTVSQRRVGRVRLRLDAVAHGVEDEVVQDLLEQAAIALGPSAALDHRQTVARLHVPAQVLGRAVIDRPTQTGRPHALPPAERGGRGGNGLRLGGGRFLFLAGASLPGRHKVYSSIGFCQLVETTVRRMP